MVKSSGLQGQYSGFMSRLFAFILDVVIISLVDVLIYLLVSAVLHQFTGFSLFACPSQESFTFKVMICRVAGWGYSVFLAGFPLVYLLFFWILVGQTVGDYALGIRVVRMNGSRMKLVTVALRILGYFVCFFSLGLGFLWILIDDRRQGWHDKLAGTCVIYAWEARQDARLIGRLSQRLFGKAQHS
jgi:uncharacterized RDD family membrane protein YckC